VTGPALPLDRVVHVASGREWRGGERQVLLLAKGLRALGLDQIVVTRRNGRLATELTEAGIPIRPVGWRMAVSPGAAVATVAEARRGRSLLHAHDAHSLTVAAVAARLSGQLFVVTRRIDLPLRRLGFWPAAARIIAISGAVRAQLGASGIAPDRIVVVPSGIEPPIAAPKAGAAPTEAEPSEVAPAMVAPVVLTIGALTAEKGHALLLETAARLKPLHPDLRWVIAGDGPLRPALEARTRELGLTAVVEFRGNLPDPRILLADATLYVSPSAHEGLGTSILDAMAAGVPVVATAVGGVVEVLGDGAGVLVDRAHPEALAPAINGLLCNETARRNVTLKAADRVRSYTVERMATGVLSVYRSVLLSP
jgi:glycosyltransferase involved in cell wall biosynthesis